jgi:hypothetical protein
MDPDATTAPPDGPPNPPTTAPLPEQVERLAATRRLGAYQVGASGDNPVTGALSIFALAALVFGVAWVLGWLFESLDVRALAWVEGLGVFIALMLAGAAVVELTDGHRASYLFDGGLVWTRNRHVESATWSEIDRLLTARALPPFQATGVGLLVAIDGRETYVDFSKDSTEFRDRLIEALEAANRPVRPSVPTDRGLAPEENPPTVALRVVAALVVGFPALVALVVALNQVAGLAIVTSLLLACATAALVTALATVFLPRM